MRRSADTIQLPKALRHDALVERVLEDGQAVISVGLIERAALMCGGAAARPDGACGPRATPAARPNPPVALAGRGG
jgi:hypothetical protein